MRAVTATSGGALKDQCGVCVKRSSSRIAKTTSASLMQGIKIVLLLFCACSIVSQKTQSGTLQFGSVYKNDTLNDKFYFVAGIEDQINGVAFGYFNNTLNVTGKCINRL